MAYPKEIAEQSRRLLDERRDRVELDRLQRVRRVAQKQPRILAVQQELATTSAMLARAVLDGADVQQKVAQIRDFNLQKQQELQTLLRENNFAPDELENRYNCPLCRDTGNRDGKLCDCARKLQQALMYERLGAVSAMADCRFENFLLDYYADTPAPGSAVSPRAVMQKALRTCVRYAEEFSTGAESLLVCGAPGLGKTHLSLAIAYRVIDRGFDVLYLPFHTLLARLETARFGKNSEEYQDYLSPVLQCELLLLDDLGSEFTTSFATSALYDIVNTRQLNGKPTIINTNLPQNELGTRYGERLRSRLLGCYRVIPCAGEDIRLKKKSY